MGANTFAHWHADYDWLIVKVIGTFNDRCARTASFLNVEGTVRDCMAINRSGG